VRAGGVQVALLPGHFSQTGLHPHRHIVGHVAGAVRVPAQPGVGGLEPAVERQHTGLAGEGGRRRHQGGGTAAGLQAFFILPLDLGDHRQRQPALAEAWILRQGLPQLVAGLGEAVFPLRDGGGQHQHRRRRVGPLQPRRQGGAGVAQITGVALAPRRLDIQACQLFRAVAVAWVVRQLFLKGIGPVENAGGRQALEDLIVGLGGIGRRHGRVAESAARKKEQPRQREPPELLQDTPSLSCCSTGRRHRHPGLPGW